MSTIWLVAILRQATIGIDRCDELEGQRIVVPRACASRE